MNDEKKITVPTLLQQQKGQSNDLNINSKIICLTLILLRL